MLLKIQVVTPVFVPVTLLQWQVLVIYFLFIFFYTKFFYFFTSCYILSVFGIYLYTCSLLSLVWTGTTHRSKACCSKPRRMNKRLWLLSVMAWQKSLMRWSEWRKMGNVDALFGWVAWSYQNSQMSVSPSCCFTDANPFAFCSDNCIVC